MFAVVVVVVAVVYTFQASWAIPIEMIQNKWSLSLSTDTMDAQQDMERLLLRFRYVIRWHMMDERRDL